MLAKGELRALLARDLPDALAQVAGHAASNGNGNAQGTTSDLVPAEPKAQTEPIDTAEAGAGHEGGARPVLQDDDVVVNAQSIANVAAYLRDQHGYEFLSNITAVDYLAEGLFEVVYHFFSLAGGGPQTVRVRIPREYPIIPTLTGEWPGANLQEREAFDMYGVQFPGHPYLRRIYMWDEFEGYPLRKDFPKTGDKYTHVTGE